MANRSKLRVIERERERGQKEAETWEKRVLKSEVGVPSPSGFEARSSALNLASSN